MAKDNYINSNSDNTKDTLPAGIGDSTSSSDMSPDRMAELDAFCDGLTPIEKDYVNQCTSADASTNDGDGNDEELNMEDMAPQ